MTSSPNEGSPHYRGASGQRYFNQFQDPLAQAGSFLNLPLYHRFVRPTDAVLDFGCGGGHLLAGLAARRKIGVDVNPLALQAARTRGLEVFDRLDEVPSDTVDVVVSNHGLEHTLRPFDVLVDLRRVTRVGGSLVLYLPAESWLHHWRFKPGDPNHHLYAWTPLLLGNLLEDAGWSIRTVRLTFHAWPPRGYSLLRFLPSYAAQLICRLCGVLLLQPQIHAVAWKAS